MDFENQSILELVARSLCKACGDDPDEIVVTATMAINSRGESILPKRGMAIGEKAWKSRLNEAGAAMHAVFDGVQRARPHGL